MASESTVADNQINHDAGAPGPEDENDERDNNSERIGSVHDGRKSEASAAKEAVKPAASELRSDIWV